MSALAWIFGLGAVAVAFPFLFHLIRRTPRGQTEFSSLMFLKPSPPTLTRRSRLENLLLLFLRAGAITLIACAFMRPFFRGTDNLAEFEVAKRRIAILVDTSASMRRTGLWEQANQQIENVLGGLEQGDSIALMKFDSTLETVVDFGAGSEQSITSQANSLREKLKTLEPSWARSDLGQALVAVAESLDVWRDSHRAQNDGPAAKLQIVVVSDLQDGSQIESLQAYQWPADVFVKFLSVTPQDYSNATVQLLDLVPEEDDPGLRIRVTNSEESNVDQFFVNGTGNNDQRIMDPISFYVPPGTSRVLKVATDDAIEARCFVVSGDKEDFDNTFYTVPIEQQKLSVAYVGNDDPNDPEQPQFYLRRALLETPSRAITIRQVKTGDRIYDPELNLSPPTLIVVTSPVNDDLRSEIDAHLQTGGNLLVVLADDEATQNTEPWTTASASRIDELVDDPKSRNTYAMLAEIDFTNPLFQPFANPRYNDFTGIRFWRHQRVELDETKVDVIARFDNHEPAFWQQSLNNGGKVFVFASGWQPQQSQLALSTKFVPLINRLVEVAAEMPELQKSLTINDSIVLPTQVDENVRRTMVLPDGSRETIEVDQTRFTNTTQPGVYRLVSRESNVDDERYSDAKGSQLAYSVNLDRAESQTTAIPIERFEMFDVKVGEQQTASSDLALMRTKRDRDLESEQKLWKYLIVAVIVLLIVETWLAGRTSTQLVANNSSFQSSTEFRGEVS